MPVEGTATCWRNTSCSVIAWLGLYLHVCLISTSGVMNLVTHTKHGGPPLLEQSDDERNLFFETKEQRKGERNSHYRADGHRCRGQIFLSEFSDGTCCTHFCKNIPVALFGELLHEDACQKRLVRSLSGAMSFMALVSGKCKASSIEKMSLLQRQERGTGGVTMMNTPLLGAALPLQARLFP